MQFWALAVLDSSFHPANVAEPGAGLLSESESLKKWIADGVILKVDVLSQFLKTLKCADLLQLHIVSREPSRVKILHGLGGWLGNLE